ncbi:glycerate kinase [Geminocystis sp. GBBB08]|uniref:glycerate kinase n=1 Tax=Geminocystis sp. GBBB08 TaxID=2604140 RepID=UPI0027E31EDD|nr:glycerate kinase [Geminocystis sp. GBBB08]MBL1208465.1 glycerate kinase [Geminocystis sp. GBBB08]
MNQLEIINTLLKFIDNNQLSSSQLKLLQDDDGNHQYPFKSQNNHKFLQQKLDILPLVYPKLNLLFHGLTLTNDYNNINNIWYFWLPLALELADKKKQQNHPLTVGILGGQGTGKTTLTKILSVLWQSLNLFSIGISLDDFYKTYQERQKLLTFDSRLIWRGPPGTHDVELGIKVLEQLHQANYPVDIPRFDKSLYNGSGDRIIPEKVTKADIIIFEGWFLGVQPVSEKAFINAPYPIVTVEDKKFALDCNERLKEYLPLWQKLDYLMIFNPENYQFSLQWRKKAEHKMINQGKTGMSDEEIKKFVHYFWKALHPQIYIKPLLKNHNLTDLVVNLNHNHLITKIDRLR